MRDCFLLKMIKKCGIAHFLIILSSKQDKTANIFVDSWNLQIFIC